MDSFTNQAYEILKEQNYSGYGPIPFMPGSTFMTVLDMKELMSKLPRLMTQSTNLLDFAVPLTL